MKLKLTVWQRFQCIQSVGNLQGTIAIFHVGGKLLDILDFTEAEKTAIRYQEISPSQAMWIEPPELFEMEIKDKNQANLLKQALQNRRDWRVDDRVRAGPLLKQVGVKVPEGD